MRIKNLLPALLLFATTAFAQVSYNSITGTVNDPDDNPFASANISATLVNAQGQPLSGAPATPNGQLYNGSPVRGTLDEDGTFGLALVPNGILTQRGAKTPGGTQWLITITAPQDPNILVSQNAWNINYQFTVSGDQDISSQLSALATQTISFLNLKSNKSSFVSASGLPVNNPAFTGALSGPTMNGLRYAKQFQTGGGNNGIANALASGQFVIADPSYGTTEAQPWGGANGYQFPPQVVGPKATDPFAQFLDTRYGVPQFVFNGSALYDSRHTNWPAFISNFTGNSGLTGTFLNPGGALHIQMNAWMGGRNFYNDKTNLSSFQILEEHYTEAQGGGSSQHDVNCYGNGDCAAESGDTVSFGGPNTASDEGNEYTRHESIQGGKVFSAHAASVATASDGSSTITTNSLVENGTQGEGRLAIDITKAYNTGYISLFTNSGGNETVTCSGGCNWDSFGASSHTTLSAAIANPVNGTNSFPQSNTVLTVADSTGFTVGNRACIFDYDYECEKITARATGTITLATVRKPHPVGSYVTTGGLAGDGIEFEADRITPSNPNGVALSPDQGVQETIREVIPIMYNSAGNQITVFEGGNYLPGTAGGYNGRAYQSMGGSGGACSVTVSGGALTGVTASGGTGYISALSPPQLVLSGSWTTAPQVYVTATSSGAISGAAIFNAGAGISGTPTCSVVTSNPYDIYPAAKTYQVYNATSGSVDGTLWTQPWRVAPSIGDTLEQPHYFWQHISGNGNQVVGQYFASTSTDAHDANSLFLTGIWQGSDTVQKSVMQSDSTLFMGYPAVLNTLGRGQLIPPTYAQVVNASVRRYYDLITPPFAAGQFQNNPGGYAPSVFAIGCGSIPCSQWTNPYWMMQGLGNGNVFEGWMYTPAINTWRFSGSYLDLTGAGVLNIPLSTFRSLGGLVSGTGYNYAPYSNQLTAATWQNTGAGTGTVTCSITDDVGDPACTITGTNTFNWQDNNTSTYTPLPAATLMSTQVRAQGSVGGENIVIGGNFQGGQVTLTTSWQDYCVTYTTDSNSSHLHNLAAIDLTGTQTIYVANVVTRPGPTCGPPITTTNTQFTALTKINHAVTFDANAFTLGGVAEGSANSLPGPLDGSGKLPTGQIPPTFSVSTDTCNANPTHVVNESYVSSCAGGGAGSGTVNSGGSYALAAYGSAPASTVGPAAGVATDVTGNNLYVPGVIATGASAPTACGSAGGCAASTEGSTAGTPTVGQCYIRADAGSNQYVSSCNGSAEAPLVSPGGGGLGNKQFTTGTTSVNPLSCTAETSVGWAGLLATSSLGQPTVTGSTPATGVSGWAPGGTLYLSFRVVAGTMFWQECNASSTSAVAAGGSITWNIGAQ